MGNSVHPGLGNTLLRGAGLAGLSRFGAVIEIATQALFIWLVGVASFGLYASLWAGVVLASTVADFAMTASLQRVVPKLDNPSAHAAVKLAMMISLVGATLVALVLTFRPDLVSTHFAAAAEDAERLPAYVSIFVWALPVWMFVEIATSALRARKAFGPEIRVRVFWEQVMRMACALTFYAGGAGNFSLIAAHLTSLVLAAAMCVSLLRRYYDLPTLLSAPIEKRLAREIVLTGAALFPSNLARRMLIHGPALALSFLLPGRHGAEAAGLFDVARRISTVPYFVRQSFEYVLAPLSAESANVRPSEVASLYGLATRIISALVLPLSTFLVFASPDVLSVYRSEVSAALPLLVILIVGRAFDAVAGPAQTVVEMTGNRRLPLINSALGIAVWLLLLFLLVPTGRGVGMAVAVAAATAITAWAAVVELRCLHGWRAMKGLWRCLAIAALESVIMAIGVAVLAGVLRFAFLIVVWVVSTWIALRWGLEREDRHAFGSWATRLRLL